MMSYFDADKCEFVSASALCVEGGYITLSHPPIPLGYKRSAYF